MIDIENEVFDVVSKAVREKYPKAFVTGEYVSAPSEFPCVSIMEVDNQVWKRARSSSEIENFAQLRYEVNVFTNDSKGKKAKCRNVISLVDDEMKRLGFTRIMLRPVPNELDSSIFRYVGRYRAIADNNHTVYRR